MPQYMIKMIRVTIQIHVIRTHIIAHTGPTNAQMKPCSVDSQQLQHTTTLNSQSKKNNDLLDIVRI